jgi:hypothetical protein
MEDRTMGFLPRYENVTPPEYPNIVLPLHCNPTSEVAHRLIFADSEEEVGALLSTAFRATKITAYDFTFDFSTPGAAWDTLTSAELPTDLRYWLRNAPIEIVEWAREETRKKFTASPKAATSGPVS